MIDACLPGVRTVLNADWKDLEILAVGRSGGGLGHVVSSQSPDWHPRGDGHKPHLRSKLQEAAPVSPSQQPPT